MAVIKRILLCCDCHDVQETRKLHTWGHVCLCVCVTQICLHSVFHMLSHSPEIKEPTSN